MRRNGDYPGLDLCSSRWLRRLRQAGAALICFVMLGVDAKANFDSRSLGVPRFFGVKRIAVHADNLSAELRMMESRSFENVSISNIPPNVKKLFPFLDLKKIIIQDDSSVSANALVCTDQGGAAHLGIRKSKIFGYFGVHQFGVDIDNHIDGRSIAPILDNGCDVVENLSRSISIWTPQPRKVGYSDESPLGEIAQDVKPPVAGGTFRSLPRLR